MFVVLWCYLFSTWHSEFELSGFKYVASRGVCWSSGDAFGWFRIFDKAHGFHLALSVVCVFEVGKFKSVDMLV